MTELMDIPLSVIDPSPLQMRHSMDLEALDLLVESLRRDSQQRPIKARPKNERYEIVFGHRTVSAARKAGLETVQAIVKDLTDEEVMWAQYAENEYREDISDYDRAKWLRSMIDKFDYSQGEIGEKAGLSRNRVNQLLRMLELKGVTPVTLSKMTEFQARAILAAPEEDQASLVNYVELFLEEKGEILPASAIEDYALQLARATEIGKSRRCFLYEIEEETAGDESPGTAEEYAEAVKAYIEVHDLGWVFDAEANGANYLTKITLITDEELQFCLAHETWPLSIQRLNEERDRRGLATVTSVPPLKAPSVEDPGIVAFINSMVGEPAEALQATLVEERGLSEEEAQAALQAYRETYPDIWERCYAEKVEEEEPEMTVEQYVADVLLHSPEVSHEELVRVAAEMFGVPEAYVQGLIDRNLGQKRGRKPRDPYAARIMCPLCGRQNAEKNRVLMVLEEYQATQPGVTLVDWLREVLL